MEYALTNGTTGTISTGGTFVSDTYIYSDWGRSTSSVSIPSCAPKESNNMKLYKVFLIRIDNRNVSETNVAARNASDAIIKAFIFEQIPADELDNFDKHAQFICDLTEEDVD